MSTIVDQSEIDALLAAAKAEAEAPPPPPAPVAPAPILEAQSIPDNLKRILRLRIPIIVRLAHDKLQLAQIRKLTCGFILEFNRDVEQPCDLMANNHVIGSGQIVRVGEHFGIRIGSIEDTATRIRSLGK